MLQFDNSILLFFFKTTLGKHTKFKTVEFLLCSRAILSKEIIRSGLEAFLSLKIVQLNRKQTF